MYLWRSLKSVDVEFGGLLSEFIGRLTPVKFCLSADQTKMRSLWPILILVYLALLALMIVIEVFKHIFLKLLSIVSMKRFWVAEE